MKLVSVGQFSGGSDFNTPMFLKTRFVLAEEPPDAEKIHEISVKITSLKLSVTDFQDRLKPVRIGGGRLQFANCTEYR